MQWGTWRVTPGTEEPQTSSPPSPLFSRGEFLRPRWPRCRTAVICGRCSVGQGGCDTALRVRTCKVGSRSPEVCTSAMHELRAECACSCTGSWYGGVPEGRRPGNARHLAVWAAMRLEVGFTGWLHAFRFAHNDWFVLYTQNDNSARTTLTERGSESVNAGISRTCTQTTFDVRTRRPNAAALFCVPKMHRRVRVRQSEALCWWSSVSTTAPRVFRSSADLPNPGALKAGERPSNTSGCSPGADPSRTPRAFPRLDSSAH